MSRVRELNVHGAKSAALEGGLDVNCLYIAANVADGETIAITRVENSVTTTRTYEFDTNGAVATAGNVLVDVSAAVTPAAAVTALVAAINADGLRVCDAADIGGNVVGLNALSCNAALTATETLAGAGNILAAAAFWGQRAEAPLSIIVPLAFTCSANARTIWAAAGEVPICGVASTAQPVTIALYRQSSGGIQESLVITTAVWRQANTNFWQLCVADGATIFDLNDVITVVAAAAMEA